MFLVYTKDTGKVKVHGVVQPDGDLVAISPDIIVIKVKGQPTMFSSEYQIYSINKQHDFNKEQSFECDKLISFDDK